MKCIIRFHSSSLVPKTFTKNSPHKGPGPGPEADDGDEGSEKAETNPRASEALEERVHYCKRAGDMEENFKARRYL